MAALTKMQAAGKMESLIGGMDDADEEAPTADRNVANRAKVIKNWALGPSKNPRTSWRAVRVIAL